MATTPPWLSVMVIVNVSSLSAAEALSAAAAVRAAVVGV
jgi:hypothetical protein